LLVIDTDGHVLLFQYEDDRGKWWATPGGGLEGEETFEEAASREAEEELSLTRVVAVPLWERSIEFTSMGRMIRQAERYFLVRRARADVALGENVREAHRREGIVAARCWSPDEIRATTERAFPEDLGERLRGLPQ
jgi:8-oxo-dGTP pyrophosphatase MutT (NUDIX family)